MAPRVSNADVAKHLGISDRRVYKMLRDGTCDRARARQLVVYFGGVEEDYFRESRPRGRPRKTDPYSFRQFIAESGECESDSGDETWDFIRRLSYLNDDGSLDSSSLIGLLLHMRGSYKYCDEEALLATEVWKRFRIWQVERECEERIFDIDVMGNLD